MIKLQDLTKQYDKFLAVDHLNLTIETGEFFGLLGPNGAGNNNDQHAVYTSASYQRLHSNRRRTSDQAK